MPRQDDYLTQLLHKIGLGDFATQTVHFLFVHVAKIGLILLVAVVASRLASVLVHRFVAGLMTRSPLRGGAPPARVEARARTVGGVLASVSRIGVWTVAVLLSIGELGFNLTPFIATASVVGVAVGFGAQSLVRDFLAGFFILVEDQYGVGDPITIADVSGVVEEVNLRVTRLRAPDGTVWFVPNGEIHKVANTAKEWAYALVDVIIGVGADLRAAISAIGDETTAVAADPAWADDVLEPEVLGVETLAVDSVTIRVSMRVTPARRAPLARELRARIISRLREDGIVGASAPSAA